MTGPIVSNRVSTVRRPMLLHRERAAGVCAEILAFLDWWSTDGPFFLVVDPKGGVRYDDHLQHVLFLSGASKAKSLGDTPHGRGGAVDAHPCIVGAQGQVIALRDKDIAAYTRFGELAEQHGLEWGGRWKHLVDMPHIERKNWRELPFPPRK